MPGEDTLLIGTVDRQVLLPAFLQGAVHKFTPYMNSGQNMAGMQTQITSGVGATSQNFEFARLSEEDLHVINDLRNGVHGPGLIYWHDPFAVNLLPTPWSVPMWMSLATQYRFDTRSSTTAKRIDVPDNNIGLPVKGIHMDFDDTKPQQRFGYTFLIPEGKDLAVGFKGLSDKEKLEYTYAWSGTHNASASTLSQDGTVVATNFFPNPGFDMDGSQPTSKKNVTSGSMSDGVLTLTRVSGSNDVYWLWRLTGLPSGTRMVSSCSMTNGGLQAWSSSWGGMDAMSFTVPDDGVVMFAFMPTSDSAATFTRPLLCTAADWAAMQSLGIDWFSGDSDGFERDGADLCHMSIKYPKAPEYTYAWSGTPNASTSTLSQDGAVVATNMFPNPAVRNTSGFWKAYASTTFLDNGVKVIDNSSGTTQGTGKWVSSPAITLSAGTYVLDATILDISAGVKPPSQLGRKMLMVGSGNIGNPTVIAGDNTAVIGEKTITFTLPSQTDIFIGLAASGGGQNGVYTTWDKVGLCSQSDYAAMQSLGVDWFSGDSEGFNDNDDIPLSSDLSKPIDVFIPNKGYGSAVLSLEGTGGADVYGMTLSVVPHGANDIWWLHHHGNMFRSGNGMVGAQFSEDDFEWTKYSLGTPWAVKPAGFTLIETEWSSN